MAIRINLLPQEMSAGKDVERVSVLLNKIAISLTVVFLMMILVGGGVFLLLNNQLNSLSTKEKELASSINSLKNTESSLILLKDRLAKVQTVLASRINETAFAKQKEVVTAITENVIYDEQNIDLGASSFKAKVASSQSLVNFVTNLMTMSNINTLIVKEVVFSQTSGYELEVDIN